MYKFLVLLCAVVAAVAEPEPEPKADPSVALAYSPYLAGAYAARPILATSYSTPLLYSAGLPAAPLAYSALAPAHYIKKRSVAALPLPTSYYAAAPYSYSYSSPLYSATYAAPIAAAPLAAPITYSHFIKKRSVAALPLATSYIAPSTYSSYSYSSPLYSSTYAAPYAYSSPYAYSGYPYFLKK